MSKAVSALNGAQFSGLAKVADAGLQGMITLRGDFAAPALKAAVEAATGAGVPERGRIARSESGAAAWMSPDELLLLVPYAEADAKVAALAEALSGEHALAVNVSDARAFISVAGEGAREVLAKVSPVDFDAAEFQPGQFRRSRLAQVAGAFWMEDDGSFKVICFRSVGEYVFKLLSSAAHPQAKVGVY
ncbi:sarcosine oxidase subunit gamma [Cribrihabitans neustonicus]|uniref:sarcosine oxidase subunit gamma n=1 Tax=Cribrihabitans neustonicus TaxID=1429085 RepID=UPI003B59CCC2